MAQAALFNPRAPILTLLPPWAAALGQTAYVTWPSGGFTGGHRGPEVQFCSYTRGAWGLTHANRIPAELTSKTQFINS